jgi:hypothetical protein
LSIHLKTLLCYSVSRISFPEKTKEAQMIKNRNINLPSLTPELYLALSLALVLLAAVIYTGLGSPLVNIDSQRNVSAASSTDYWAADAARWEALAEYYLKNPAPGLTRAQAAEAARLEALAKYYLPNVSPVLTRAQAADADRLEALAEYYLPAPAPALTRAQAAYAARLEALAAYYRPKAAPALTLPQAVEAARLTGLSIYYWMQPSSISIEVLKHLSQ